MKKILFVTHALSIGGVTKVLINLVNALILRGYQIDILCTSKRIDISPNLLNPHIGLFIKDEKEFKIRRKIKFIRNFYGSGDWFSRQTPNKLYQYYVGEKKIYDVEIAFFYGRPIKVIYGSTNRNSRKIVWIHSDYQLCDGYYNGFNKKEDALNAYNSFDNIITVSKNVEESFKKVTGITQNIKTIYNLNNIDEIRQLSNDEISLVKNKFTIIAVGRLAEEKGFIRVIDVIKGLTSEGYNIDLWIIGDGPERSNIEQHIKESGLGSIVKLLGEKQNPYPYIKKADLLVCSSFHEGYNLTIAESIIIGTPVISTNCSGPAELLDNGSYGLIVDNSCEGIYQGIKTMIINKELYGYYKNKIHERMNFFDESSIIKDVEELFK